MPSFVVGNSLLPEGTIMELQNETQSRPGMESTLTMAFPIALDQPTTITTVTEPKRALAHREKRHCWECMRRRLVCDSAPGACNKCKTRGVVCPGYDNKKPLRWLTPGKVKSKPRRPKTALAAASTVAKTAPKKAPKAKSQPSDKSMIPVIYLTQSAVEKHKWQNDVCDIVQAVAFYNNWIYPAWDSTREIASSEWITPLPLGVLNGVEPAISHSLTFCTLSYRFTQLSSPSSASGMDDHLAMATKMYYHRDIAVRALSEALSDPRRQTSNVTLLAVFLFLLVDISQARMNWRHHYDGLATLIRIRGGLTTNILPQPYHSLVIAYYFVTGVIGNTTSPAHDLAEPFMFTDNIDMVAEYYGDGRFPTLMCPPDMFLCLARINHLRAQAASPTAPEVQSLKPRALALVGQVDAFGPEDWAYAFPVSENQGNLLLLARIYQSATMVFCLSSLQSVRVLPRSGAAAAALQATRARHHARLLEDLREGLCRRSLRFREVMTKCILWPLMIAGTGLRSHHGSSLADRTFIQRELESMSPAIGSYLPVYALSLIKRFWREDELDWDECFDEPRAFVT